MNCDITSKSTKFQYFRDFASKFVGLLPDLITSSSAMEASDSPSISRAPMGGGRGEGGGGMLSEYRKLVYADDRYNDNILSFAYLCRSFFLSLRKGEQSFLYATRRLDLIHITLKFGKNIPYGYLVMVRTRKVYAGRTDGWTTQ